MNIWSFILSKSKENQDVILMVVIDNQGSSPGRKGFKMAVSEDGRLNGSIGGGLMEKQMVEEARQMIHDKNPQIILRQQDHNQDAAKDKSGMICSGSQTIAFFPINNATIKVIEKIVESQSTKKQGQIKYLPSGIKITHDEQQEERYISKIKSDIDWELSELLGVSDKLYIFGAGHVGLALSQVCSLLDFEIEIFDNREELSTFQENVFATRKAVIDYNDIAYLITEGSSSYAVITSHTHHEDEILLGQLIGKNLKYLGMLGSRKKVEKIRSNLMARGHRQEVFNRVHSPIGIDIKSQTPMEIAISIAAEMIKTRNS